MLFSQVFDWDSIENWVEDPCSKALNASKSNSYKDEYSFRDFTPHQNRKAATWDNIQKEAGLD
jgi:hypothetical protein